MFSGQDGEVYISGDDTHYKIATSTSRLGFTWVSKILTMGTASMDKKFYLVRLSKNASQADVTISLNGGAFTAYTDNEISLANRKAKTMQIKIVGQNGSLVQSLGVVFRRLVGYR
jgi:hypothetical protein